ncbi:MAG: hypothetical protein A3G29_00740 [Burkholderiales bacterium RIFCSPLOWO2_12_FULL_64_99]|nr:MAG: hypothetical protein A3E52_01605 [Burkholderiales bacterium RIFCSPHIGHO2_12_FULL_63_20]OGB67541.1 MAG: hypothetical protein A3G29_00740 [Burkholderiales bacterium RIFCSPLOWO2_12_FULL_64_99]
MKQWKQVSAVATAVMALASGGVHALGLGVPNSRAILGESLRMSIPLELESGEDTDDGCPQAEVFYGDSRLDAGKVILGVSPQTGRQRVITVRAIQPINEPLIEVTLSYGCGARLSRKFTVFASPPEFVPTVVLSPATTSAPTDGEGVRAGVRAPALPATVSPRASSDRAAAAAVRDPDAAPRATRPVPVRRPVKVPVPQPKAQPTPPAPPPPVRVAEPVPAPAPAAVPASVPTPAPKASSVVLRRPSPAPKAAPVSRLVLDPVVMPVAAPLPGAGVSGAASGVQPNLVTSQAGTDLERLQAQMAQDRQRLNEMEKLITQLRLESAQAQASAAGVGLERPLALSDARHPVWLLAVSAVAALSLLFSGYLLLRLRRQEQARAWWSPPDR